MLGHVLAAVAPLAPERVVVVVGPGMEPAVAPIAAESGLRCTTVVQAERLGTGHAVAAAKEALEGYWGPRGNGDILVVCGDTPLLRTDTLHTMVTMRRGTDAPALLALTFRPADPAQYGRVLVDADGQVLRIVEYADASYDERRIEICNAGIVLGDGPVLIDLIERLGNDNAKGEYYLTDVYALAHAAGHRVRAVEADSHEVLGVNSRAELAAAEAAIQARLRAAVMACGATLVDPGAVWLSWDTRLGRDVTVEPGVVFGPGVVVGDRVRIRAFCHLEGVRIEAGATLGPFARLRPGTELGEGARVGNFVEIKNAHLGPGAKVNHLSYIGDAAVGAAANVGAGTITCNYDGIAKHRTTIGQGAFIGSNTALVAPVTIGAAAIVGAGSTITRDVPADAIAVVRGEERLSRGAAPRFRERRRALKAKAAETADKAKAAPQRADGLGDGR
ncbi:MAG: bifunctional UDP-N-acetylglucosamine diphosphorylase/glucosamine-1-phosphate N-acetyltransferase GlmU, partial [Alphaproteobacteria bacterium]